MKIKGQTAILALLFVCLNAGAQAQTDNNRTQNPDKSAQPGQHTTVQNQDRTNTALQQDTLPPGQYPTPAGR